MSRRPEPAALDRPGGTPSRQESWRVQREAPASGRELARQVPPHSSGDRTGLPRPERVQLERSRTPGREPWRRGTARWGRHRLATDSVEALRLVGAFGTVDVGDLRGMFESARRLRHAILDLQRAGLLQVDRFRRGRRVVDAATLTGAGKRLLERSVDPRVPGDERAQSYRAGPVRSAQVLHDTAVFRAARREVRAIEALGGQVRRIRTDGDLQRLAWRSIESAKRDGATREDAQAAAAASLHLYVCDGRLTFPDVRIEYELQDAEQGPVGNMFVDVEVATADYRDAVLRAKQAAGFRVYTMNSDGSLGSDVTGRASNRTR